MPVYLYKCKCGKEVERFFTTISKGMKSIPCPDCGRGMTRTPALGSFSLKGKGWFKDGYSK